MLPSSIRLLFGLSALSLAGCALDERKPPVRVESTMLDGMGGSTSDAGSSADGAAPVNAPSPGDIAAAVACSIANGGCDPLTVCTTTSEGRECSACPEGYTGDGASDCVDVNECDAVPRVCEVGTVCLNLGGGHDCAPCPGQLIDGVCTCGQDGGECRDVDECLIENGGCDPLAPCINTLAGRDCGECPAGYTGNGEVGCADVDECLTNNGGCDARTLCSNTIGSFECGPCPSGFSGTGASGCTDIDECSLDTHDCFAATGCSNSVGAFTCACPDFFFGDGRACAAAPKAFGYAQMITGDGVFYLWNRETRNNVATAIADVNWAAFASGDGGCGINGNGALFCWDYDSPGSPIRIGNATNWQKVDGANTSMCAIQSGGNLFCWPNGNGALGSGDAASSLPVAVAPEGNWTEVSAGDYNGTCGIRNGQLFCWGRNVRGILGIGGGVDNLDQFDTPQRVGNASDWTSVAVGEAHACGIRAGSLFCWGAAFANAQADDVDAPVRVGNATDWVAVSCGIAHSLGLRGNGQLFFWGQGIFGAFPTDSQTPLQVGADRSWQRPIFADYALSCATSGADAYCFGQDATVDPDAPPTDTPVRIRR